MAALITQLQNSKTIPKLNCNPLPSLHSCTPFSKYLFYLVLCDLFITFIRVFGGIRKYNTEIIK